MKCLKIDDAVINGLAIEIMSLDSDYARDIFRRTSDGKTQEEIVHKDTSTVVLGKSLRQINAQTFPPRKFAVKDLITTGITILSGQPKVGKSYYALQLAACVASGVPFLGRQTRQGTVLYLALEDDELRIFERTKAMGYHEDDGVLDNLRFETEETWDSHAKDPLSPLLKYGEHCDGELSLIIIDTLQCFRGVQSEGGNIYSVDNAYMKSLRKISVKTNTPIILVHHTKKNTTGDYITDGSGSMGLAGGASTVLTFYRDATQAHGVIKGAGKDVMAIEEWVLWEQDYCRFMAVPEQEVPMESRGITNPDTKYSRGPSTETLIMQAVLSKGKLNIEQLTLFLRQQGSTVVEATIRSAVKKLVFDKVLKTEKDYVKGAV